MKRINVFGIVVFFCLNATLNAQSFREEKNGLCYDSYETGGMHQKIRLTVWDSNIIRVAITRNEDFSDRESLIITEKSKSTPGTIIHSANSMT